jgi:ankyrin repeat protein
LYQSIRTEESDMFTALLRSDADASYKDKDASKCTVLHCAAEENDMGNWFEKLVDAPAGMEIDAQDDEGQSALFIASSSGNYENVKILLNHGASVILASKNEGKSLSALQENN